MCEYNYSGAYCQECNKLQWQNWVGDYNGGYSGCDHNFKFSHIEYPRDGSYSAIPPNKEVVICTKCGEMRKTIQYY